MKLLRSAYAYTGVLAAGATLIPAVARADMSLPQPDPELDPGGTTLEDFIGSVSESALNVVFLIAGILAVFYLIWSGIQYITSSGSPDKAKAARTGIINAIIGIVVIMAAYFIIRFAVTIGDAVDNSAV